MKIPLPLFGFCRVHPVLFFDRVFDLCLLENNVRHLAYVISDPPFSCRGTEKEENMGKHPDYAEENEDDQKMIRSLFKNFFCKYLASLQHLKIQQVQNRTRKYKFG